MIHAAEVGGGAPLAHGLYEPPVSVGHPGRGSPRRHRGEHSSLKVAILAPASGCHGEGWAFPIIHHTEVALVRSPQMPSPATLRLAEVLCRIVCSTPSRAKLSEKQGSHAECPAFLSPLRRAPRCGLQAAVKKIRSDFGRRTIQSKGPGGPCPKRTGRVVKNGPP